MRKNQGLWQRLQLSFAFFMLLQTVSFIAAGQVVVSGKVTGPDGGPLPYASVQILNTSAGASTNESGEFILLRPPSGRYIYRQVHRSWIENSRSKY